MQRRFDHIPDNIPARLDALSLASLERVLDAVLETADLDSFLTQLTIIEQEEGSI